MEPVDASSEGDMMRTTSSLAGGAEEGGSDAQSGMTTVDLAARRRAHAVAKGALMPFYRPLTGAAIATVVGGLVTAIAYLASASSPFALGTGLAVAGMVGVVAWRPMASADFRAAAELVHDHHCHEVASWKRETGTSLPRTRAGQMRWLEENPTSSGRASLLLALGRLVEADAAIDAMRPETPEDQFDVALLRATRQLCAGAAVDTSPLRDLCRELPPGREHRHRLESTAVLDAMVANAGGRDPIPGLAQARRELDGVHWTMRTPWVAARWIATGIVGSAIGLGIGLVVQP